MVPLPTPMDVYSTRLGALFHDIGHGPFSHVTEPAIRACLPEEFDSVEAVLRSSFEGVTRVATSEILAVLFVLSEPMRSVLEHPAFGAVTPATELAAAIASRILGSRSGLTATYLSGVVSGPLDADKLDYMARDSHHSGLPVALDINRLISKLEVVIVTPENAPNSNLRHRAEESPTRRFYEMGISLAGLGAYEQMIIGRVILYDRLYYHHKVRAAETMARSLLSLAAQESGGALVLGDFFSGVSDDSLIAILSGHLGSRSIPSGRDRAASIGTALLGRRVYHRAFAFAARFIGGHGGLPEQERQDTKALLWSAVLTFFSSGSDPADQLAGEIYEKSMQIAAAVPELAPLGEDLSAEHVLVDLPLNKAVVRGSDILTRTEDGHVNTPNLFFNPEQWSQAYEYQKQCGFVFCPKDRIPLVALAAGVVFFERFKIVMTADASSTCKTVGRTKREWVEQTGGAGLCSAECLAALSEERPRLLQLRSDEIKLPNSWKTIDPGGAKRLAQGFRQALPGGLPASIHRATIDAIQHLAGFVQMSEEGGLFVGLESLSERELQTRLRDHLRSREVAVQEGTEVGGGETDLVLPGNLIVENKVRGTTADPFDSGSNYPWQARRYAIAMSTTVSFVVVAYKPSGEQAILPLPQRIAVAAPEGTPEAHARLRVVIPWGHAVPSAARAPS